jgi:hypothetical protein
LSSLVRADDVCDLHTEEQLQILLKNDVVSSSSPPNRQFSATVLNGQIKNYMNDLTDALRALGQLTFVQDRQLRIFLRANLSSIAIRTPALPVERPRDEADFEHLRGRLGRLAKLLSQVLIQAAHEKILGHKEAANAARLALRIVTEAYLASGKNTGERGLRLAIRTMRISAQQEEARKGMAYFWYLFGRDLQLSYIIYKRDCVLSNASLDPRAILQVLDPRPQNRRQAILPFATAQDISRWTWQVLLGPLDSRTVLGSVLPYRVCEALFQ